MKIFTLLSLFAVFAITANAQLVDPDLETGVAGYWNESSTNFGTPLCDAACGDCGGDCAPQSGDWYAWFGGAGGVTEEGSINQDLTIPAGSSAELSFYVMIASGGSGSDQDVLNVQMDGTTIWTATGADSADYDTYTMVTVSISPYADGGDHWINIEGNNNSGANINMLVDNFNMTVDGNSAVGINELLNHETELMVYPNPAVNELNVVFNHEISGMATARVYNMNGQLVIQERFNNVNNKQYSLNTSSMENGLYFIEVEAGTQVVKTNFMVQK